MTQHDTGIRRVITPARRQMTRRAADRKPREVTYVPMTINLWAGLFIGFMLGLLLCGGR